MTSYPDNVRRFVTQKSVPLGDSPFDVEVEIVRKSDVETRQRNGEEIVSIGLWEYCPLPPMKEDEHLVVFDLGTVLDVGEVRLANPESGSRLEIRRTHSSAFGGPVRVPVALRSSARVSLDLRSGEKPFGTLDVAIEDDGKLADAAFAAS